MVRFWLRSVDSTRGKPPPLPYVGENSIKPVYRSDCYGSREFKRPRSLSSNGRFRRGRKETTPTNSAKGKIDGKHDGTRVIRGFGAVVVRQAETFSDRVDRAAKAVYRRRRVQMDGRGTKPLPFGCDLNFSFRLEHRGSLASLDATRRQRKYAIQRVFDRIEIVFVIDDRPMRSEKAETARTAAIASDVRWLTYKAIRAVWRICACTYVY